MPNIGINLWNDDGDRLETSGLLEDGTGDYELKIGITHFSNSAYMRLDATNMYILSRKLRKLIEEYEQLTKEHE
jgi:hypothetical protein